MSNKSTEASRLPPSVPSSAAADRLHPIEGLRGYLALCVLLSHLPLNTYSADNLSEPLRLLHESGNLSVHCFVIISGFVIFLLLDSRHEPYRVFICRRFFRIFPVYILLFALSIPCLCLAKSNFMQSAALGWFAPHEVASFLGAYKSYWQNLSIHVPLHVCMVQGCVPDCLLPNSSTAFLGPAWSLSLEWQFYLIAPLWLLFATSQSVWKRVSMYAVILLVMLGSRHYLPAVGPGAALPFHIEHFFFGLVCYLAYRALKTISIKEDCIFPVVLIVGLAIFKWSGRGLDMLPFLVWALVFALLIEPSSSISSRFITPLFTNRISVWLGKISFSVYLSHALVIIVAQRGVLEFFPAATQMQHMLILGAATLGITIPLSTALYYGIEAPFIKMGKQLTSKKSPEAQPSPDRT